MLFDRVQSTFLATPNAIKHRNSDVVESKTVMDLK